MTYHAPFFGVFTVTWQLFFMLSDQLNVFDLLVKMRSFWLWSNLLSGSSLN